MKKIVLAGRANVGKSTLFNRIVGRRKSIVYDTPGVTRDIIPHNVSWGGLHFTLCDMAGLEDEKNNDLTSRMSSKSQQEITDADVILFMVDARAGLLPLDYILADKLRRSKKPVILLANKCEGKDVQNDIYDFYKLGLGDPIAVSSEHGEGMGDLLSALRQFVPANTSNNNDENDENDEYDDEKGAFDDNGDAQQKRKVPIRLAILGRPNAGKSTLVNKIIKSDKALMGDEAGITRDAVDYDYQYHYLSADGDKMVQKFILIDTAGLRKKSKIQNKLEHLSNVSSLQALKFAEIAMLVIDATHPMEKQDLTLARLIHDEGRVPIIILNKWDLVKNKQETLQHINDKIQTSMTQVKKPKFITLSALNEVNFNHLFDTCLFLHQKWNARFSTSLLNQWLYEVTASNPPPLAKGRRIKIRYMTQIKARPPSFVLFLTQKKEMPASYIRYLQNRLCEDFALFSIPLRFILKQGKNPYAKE